MNFPVTFICRPNKKRQHKNTKYGFGGQKSRAKFNTAESAGDISGFSIKQNQGRPGIKQKKVSC